MVDGSELPRMLDRYSGRVGLDLGCLRGNRRHVSVVIIRLTVLTYYVWIAVTGESGRSYLKAWLEALGEDRARRLPTRSPMSADP